MFSPEGSCPALRSRHCLQSFQLGNSYLVLSPNERRRLFKYGKCYTCCVWKSMLLCCGFKEKQLQKPCTYDTLALLLVSKIPHDLIIMENFKSPTSLFNPYTLWLTRVLSPHLIDDSESVLLFWNPNPFPLACGLFKFYFT